VETGSDVLTITQVEYFHGSTSLGVTIDQPFTVNMPRVAAGTYSIVARATTTDPNNPVLQSPPLILTVAAPVGVATAYFIHTDQLNTPRAITNGTGALVWQWDSDPFGKDAPNEQPTGQSVFTFNLRFPGQQFDRESNLHYNYFRDYDPQTGRYIQSDPIGLAGGINTFGYAGASPVRYTDPMGLAYVCTTIGFVTTCKNTPPPGMVDPLNAPQSGSQPWISNAGSGAICPPTTDKAGRKVSPSADTMNPPGNCTPGEQERMQQAVNNACKRPRACKPGQMNVDMVIMRENSRECAIARDRINNVCFMGGDVGHRNAAIDAWNSVANCDGMIP
jgi:RHS repeat-associated protein